MFKFEFTPSSQSQEKEDCVKTGDEVANLVWIPSKEIVQSATTLNRFGESNSVIDIIQLQSESLLFVKPSSILSSIKDKELQTEENIFLADQNDSDLIPSKYEGSMLPVYKEFEFVNE